MQFILALICFVSYSYGVSLLEDGYAYLSQQLNLDLEPSEEAVESLEGAAPVSSTADLLEFDEAQNQAEFDYNFGKFMVIVAIVFAFLAGAFR